MRWLKQQLRARLAPSGPAEGTLVEGSLADKAGGYDWSCGGMSATEEWITSGATRAALHLPPTGSGSRFGYRSSGPASVTLWPFLATKLRVLIYNGACPAEAARLRLPG